jgi:hypothetical protein
VVSKFTSLILTAYFYDAYCGSRPKRQPGPLARLRLFRNPQTGSPPPPETTQIDRHFL